MASSTGRDAKMTPPNDPPHLCESIDSNAPTSSGSPPPQITLTTPSLTVNANQNAPPHAPSPLNIATSIPPPNSESEPKASTVKSPERIARSISGNTAVSVPHFELETGLAYNHYSELVEKEKIMRPPQYAELGVTESLRLFHRTYQYESAARMREIIAMQVDHDGKRVPGFDSGILKRRLTSWDLVTTSPGSFTEASSSKGTPPTPVVRVFKGPTRVLELGCGNGEWCFTLKADNPDWIVEGLDDSDLWSATKPGVQFGDFMESVGDKDGDDYFGKVKSSQKYPEFTVRDINSLQYRQKPIPENMYSFVRGRDVFDRVRNYKQFLDDIRVILQPDGVVEFMEIDPRPRVPAPRRPSDVDDHVNGPAINWGKTIADRFRDPDDDQLNIDCPEWSARVEKRLEAALRPRDGIPAASLKDWMQGIGFGDVKESIIRLVIGGPTLGGQALLKEMLHEIEMEDQIPVLAEKLPSVDLSSIVNTKTFFINLHILTGRKPKYPRPGDLLANGQRQDMSTSMYDNMARQNDARSNQWMRYDNDIKLAEMMRALSTLHIDLDSAATNPQKEMGESSSLAGTGKDSPGTTGGSVSGSPPTNNSSSG